MIEAETKSFQLEQRLIEFQQSLTPILRRFFETQKRHALEIDPILFDLANMLEEFTLRPAKRIRPALLYYGYQCFSDEHLNNVLDVTVCLEMLQTFLLVHDDIMDQAVLRRGKKSMQQLFLERSAEQKQHDANSMAMLIGDIANYWALNALSDSLISSPFSKQFPQILKQYSKMGTDVCFGQALDMKILPLAEVTEDFILKVYRYKTASYTTETPLLMAALLAQQTESIIAMMQKIGIELGTIFQLEDDILGIFGDPDQTGKSNLDDIKEGKKTLLIWYAWEASNLEQKKFLQAHYGSPMINTADLIAVKHVMKETGALDRAEDFLNKKLMQLRSIVESSFFKSEGAQFLWELMIYVGRRNK